MDFLGPEAAALVVGASLEVVADSAADADVEVDSSVLVSDPQPERPIASPTAAMAMTPARVGMVMSSPVCRPVASTRSAPAKAGSQRSITARPGVLIERHANLLRHRHLVGHSAPQLTTSGA